MYKLILEELPSVLAYQTLEREWGDARKIDSEDGFFELKNPMVVRSARDLVNAAKDVEYAWKLSVRDSAQKRWRKFMLDGLEDASVIATIARLMQSDPLKRNFLEITLSRSDQHYADCPTLEFAQRGDLVVGYKVRAPYAGLDLLEIKGRPYRAINALADARAIVVPRNALEEKLVLPDDQRSSRTG